MKAIQGPLLFVLLLTVSCQRDPKVRSEEYFQSGQDYFSEEQYQEAAIQFRNAVKADEKNSRAHLALAQAYQKLQDNQNAITELRKVLELDKDNVEAKLDLGRYYLLDGIQNADSFDKSRALAEEVLSIEPANVRARILLGNSYAGLNDLERSVDEMEAALRQDPANLTAYLDLGAVQWKSKDKKKAEETFLKAVEQHPDSVPAHLALANFYMLNRQMDKAQLSFRKAFDLAPENRLALYSLVRYYLTAKREDMVEAVLQEAIERTGSREPRWALANFYLQRGRINEGMKRLQGLLDQDPGDREAEIRMAEVYLSRGETEKAEQSVLRLLARNKNDDAGHYLRGKLLLAGQNPDDALMEFDKAIDLNPYLWAAYMEKASLLLSRKEFSQSQEVLTEVLRLNRNFLPAKAGLAKVLALTQRPEEALQLAQDVLAVQPLNPDALLARGESLLAQRRLDPAREDFKKLSSLQPQNPFVWHRLGSVEVLAGNSSAALQHFHRALDIRPDLDNVLNDLVYIYLKDKKYQQALNELNQLAEKSPRSDSIHIYKGRVFLAQGDSLAARAEFRRASEINPDNYESYVLLAQLNAEENKLTEAVKEVDQLIARDKKFIPAYLLKATYLYVGNDIPGAVYYYKETLKRDPDNSIAANNLSWLYCERGENLNEALDLARIARKREPSNPHYADTLGWVYYKLENYTLAVDQLLFSVNNSSKPRADNYFRLGMAYYQKGEQRLAKQTLKKALQLDDSFEGAPTAREVLQKLG